MQEHKNGAHVLKQVPPESKAKSTACVDGEQGGADEEVRM
eukprot:CAMPEP_0206256804 /NCGR_PEP_ID=MMETSP0047_2-20121206/24985_1 /ASSEMBLY_ACC=CAM_ASM_000192 /TAXON_ID=195065 /ORGANISM="Chroomonas mesostigmatica_cf, Strain CCMP1168" /LENGTH=39 /DNA_ID= /DNA_START= /DNA_END= /DNA_ORIENTATION=